MSDKQSIFRWLGRQVGHVKQAVKPSEKVVYEHESVEEQDHPEDSTLKLRRTTKDQVVKKTDPGMAT